MSTVAGRVGRCLPLPWSLASTFAVARLNRVILSLALMLAASCGNSFLKGLPAGAIVGRPNLYDYSPSVIESGNTIQVWWCGSAPNPNNTSQTSDTIQYSTIDPLSGKVSDPQTVMGETPGAWDSAYTCNPQVTGGTFVNPLGDQQTYSYAMYYVGTALPSGFDNSIGVAFSNDGIHWKKYPHPVIGSATAVNYGVGQPAPYNSDGKAGITLFYEDSNSASGPIHKEATSTDGIHFQTIGTLTTNGLKDARAGWGDMAYDAKTGYWYAAFNMPLRPQSATTGNTQERGQMGVTLYRIPAGSLLTGATPWQQLHSFDTNATGYESNFIAGFLRDQYGNVNVGPYPTIELLTSISNPVPAWNATPAQLSGSAQPAYWDVGVNSWTAGQPLLPLNLYQNASVHETTTGWIDPAGGFTLQSTVAHLYEAPQNGANLALYSCKSGATNYFVSTSSNCAGQFIVGLEGYGYAQPPSGIVTVPLYSCATSKDHFVSSDPKCGGHAAAGTLLGYGLP